jgi:hypothetical protein
MDYYYKSILRKIKIFFRRLKKLNSVKLLEEEALMIEKYLIIVQKSLENTKYQSRKAPSWSFISKNIQSINGMSSSKMN